MMVPYSSMLTGYRRPANAQTSLCKCAVSSKSSLLEYPTTGFGLTSFDHAAYRYKYRSALVFSIYFISKRKSLRSSHLGSKDEAKCPDLNLDL